MTLNNLTRIWTAGSMRNEYLSSKRQTQSKWTYDEEFLRDCKELIKELLDNDDDNELARLVFKNPRQTGTILLGISNIFFWNTQGFGDGLRAILYKLTEPASTIRIKQTGKTKSVAKPTDEQQPPSLEIVVLPPTPSSVSSQDRHAALSILHLTKKKIMEDMSWLQGQNVPEEIAHLLVNSTMHLDEPPLSPFRTYHNQYDDSPVAMESDDDEEPSFFESPSVVVVPKLDITPYNQPPELVTMRLADAAPPSARVRRRSDAHEHNIPIRVKKKHKHKRLFPIIDVVATAAPTEGLQTNKHSILNHFENRVHTTSAPLWLPLLSKLCNPIHTRFKAAANYLALSALLPERLNLAAPPMEIAHEITEDELGLINPITPKQPRRDSEMDYDSSIGVLSSDLTQSLGPPSFGPPSFGPQNTNFTPGWMNSKPDSTPESLGMSQHTVSAAELQYDTNTWRLRCFIVDAMRQKRIENPKFPPSVTFDEIVPTDRCNKIQAVVTFKHLLILATGNDVVLHQEAGSTDIIVIKESARLDSQFIPSSSGTWTSGDSGMLLAATGKENFNVLQTNKSGWKQRLTPSCSART